MRCVCEKLRNTVWLNETLWNHSYSLSGLKVQALNLNLICGESVTPVVYQSPSLRTK